jgi:oxaloacetate decarboxylase alpha subunit
MKATKKEGGHAQGTICYTISPVHDIEQYIKDAKGLVDAGADSICIKDMAGLLLPYRAYDLVKAIKETVDIPVQLHTHSTSGTANMVYLKAVEAGVDIIDTAISPLSMGTAQPATEPLIMTFQGTEYDTGLDINKVNEIADYFRPIRDKYIENGLLNPKVMGVNIKTLLYQVPGGMLSNLVSQLKQAGQEDKFDEVLEEVPRVREDFGFPPLVTPTSQIVGTQAVMNVIAGERYKMIPNESKALVRGEYGRTPVPIKKEIIELILGDEEPITCRPADLLEPGLDKFREEMKEYLEQEEDVLSYAVFPKVAIKFFKQRRAAKYKIDKDLVDMENAVHPI